jgi:hypothetical protein
MKLIHTFGVVASLIVGMSALEAQQASPPVAPAAPRAPQPQKAPQPPAPAGNQVAPFSDERGARDTRERLREVLEQYPPSVRQVLRIDPSLLSRPDYLATYPALAAFLEQHPEVAHSPAYFIGDAPLQFEIETSPRSEGFRTVRDIASYGTTVLIVMTITGGLVWLIRSLLEQRRWQRAARAQTELHTKLIDRFSSSEDLVAYLQSPAGKAFGEMPAVPSSQAPRGMDAPLGRIFWPLQGGIVLGAAGAALLLVGSRISEIGEGFFAIGTIVLAIGIGLVASAGISYVLSQRLGLLQPMPGRFNEGTPNS